MYFFSLFPPLCFLLGSGALLTTTMNSAILVDFEFWQATGLPLKFSFLFDMVSSMFLLTVTSISFGVILFSCSYMRQANSSSKFYLIVLSFVASMVFLILSPSLPGLMLGWDGLGVTSFFLVIFYKSKKANSAGLLTALSNRVGDALILVSLGLIFTQPSSSLFSLSSLNLPSSLSALSLLVVATFTKSAQLPFSAWLPAAMAAPTPVSALVHSSTLVTAGVYIIVRLGGSLENNELMAWVGGVGAITMSMASLSAMWEADMKKIIALSTLSQLGVMMSAASLKASGVLFFHLIAHAYFKALLFIATGALIHNFNDYQELRFTGKGGASLHLTKSTVLLCKASLCGLPFFSAFFSKESILESLASGEMAPLMTFLLMWFGVFCTALYSARFIYYVLLGASNNQALTFKSDKDMWILGAGLFLTLQALMGGKFLFFSMGEMLPLPFVGSVSKISTFLIIGSAPVALGGLVLLPPKSSWKAMGYLWFLPLWSSGGPTSLMSSVSHKLFWLNSTGALDKSLFSWAKPPLSPLVTPSPHYSHLFSSTLISSVLLLSGMYYF